MLDEHADGRALIRAMGEDASASRVASAQAYVALLREPILKENDILFPLAEPT